MALADERMSAGCAYQSNVACPGYPQPPVPGGLCRELQQVRQSRSAPLPIIRRIGLPTFANCGPPSKQRTLLHIDLVHGLLRQAANAEQRGHAQRYLASVLANRARLGCKNCRRPSGWRSLLCLRLVEGLLRQAATVEQRCQRNGHAQRHLPALDAAQAGLVVVNQRPAVASCR